MSHRVYYGNYEADPLMQEPLELFGVHFKLNQCQMEHLMRDLVFKKQEVALRQLSNECRQLRQECQLTFNLTE
jgi:hypothetical protein